MKTRNAASRSSRRLLAAVIGSALIGAVLMVVAAPATATAICLPTDYTQDGMTLTAALTNPLDAAVPEDLDATGCDIGIYYNDGSHHSLVDKNVFGSRYYGILARNASTVVDLSHGSVHDVGNDPKDGSQHGMAIGYRDGASGTVDSSQVYDYQKGGILADGAGSSVHVTNNTIRGLGPVPFIAQNGVQISRGATGNVNNNFIKDHQYTGCSKAQDRAGSCTYVVSTGILLFSVDTTQVDTKNNLYRNNDVNLLNASNS